MGQVGNQSLTYTCNCAVSCPLICGDGRAVCVLTLELEGWVRIRLTTGIVSDVSIIQSVLILFHQRCQALSLLFFFQVYKLEPRAYDVQVQQLVLNKQFELALEVAVSHAYLCKLCVCPCICVCVLLLSIVRYIFHFFVYVNVRWCVLQELIKESEEEHKTRCDEILRRFAFFLFTQHKFTESLEHYLQIKEGELIMDMVASTVSLWDGNIWMAQGCMFK